MIEGVVGEGIVFFGFSANILGNLSSALPDGSVVVYEEPDVVRKRDMHKLAEGFPMVARVVPWEYQRRERLESLLAEDPVLRSALAIVPGVEYGVEAAAVAADALGLPGAGSSAGHVFRDKYRMRELAARAGIANPRYERIETAAQAQAFFDSIGTACVLKPTGRQASLGVQIVTGRDEIASGWRWSTDVDEGRVVPDRGVASDLIIEEALSGHEFSVELLVAGGATCFANVTAKDVLGGRFPVELGHVLPADVDAELTRSLVASTERLYAAAGFGAGVLHCEWIVDGGRPFLVECAARMPGDEIPKLLELAYGFPFVAAYVRTLLGQRPEAPAAAGRAAAIRFLTAPPGVVTAVHGVGDARALPGVETVKVTATEGQRVAAAKSSWDRAGYVMTTAPTAAEAAAIAAKAAAAISITTQRRSEQR